MHVLVAPGRFDARPDDGPARPRGVPAGEPWPALTAAEAVAAMSDGWRAGAPDDTLVPLPLSDGGPGLLDAVRAARGGELLPVTTTDAHGAVVPGAVLVVTEASGARTAYVDGALALGAADPAAVPVAATTSAGLGTLVAAALGTGAGRVVVGLGGRRTVAHDAGAGMLAALGAAPASAGAGLDAAAGLSAGDLAGVPALREVLAGGDLVALRAHDLPLAGLTGVSADLGESGRVDPGTAQDVERAVAAFVHAAAVAAERGGAAGGDPRRDLLARPAPGAGVPGHGTGQRSASSPGGAAGAARAAGSRAALVPGSGAGGGVAFALSLLGARVVDGAAWVADVVDLPARVADADLVLTGAGVLDAATLEHGVVAAVARTALPLGVPSVALAATLRTGRRDWAAAGLSGVYAVVERPDDEQVWRDDPAAALRARLPRIARTWSR